MRVIIPSLGYADFLAVTLPAWRELLPDAEIVVITRADDPASHAVARSVLAVPVSTERWTADGARLNKARALDLGLPGEPGEICITADADVVPFGTLPSTIDAATIYGCARYRCDTPETLSGHQSGRLTRAELRLIPPRRTGEEPSAWPTVTPHQAAERCVGYFQMFRFRYGLTFGSFQTAGGYDSAFRRQFPRRAGLTEFYVLHLGPVDRRNWSGRILPPWPAAEVAS